MSATINQCLEQLKSDLETAFVAGSGGDGSVNDVRDYRTWPGLLDVTISLSYQGGAPQNSVTAGDRHYYDVLAVIGVQMDTDVSGNVTETELRAADRALNAIENGIYDLVDKGGAASRNNYWMRVSFYQRSERPPQFDEMPETRIGLMYLRLHLK